MSDQLSRACCLLPVIHSSLDYTSSQEFPQALPPSASVYLHLSLETSTTPITWE